MTELLILRLLAAYIWQLALVKLWNRPLCWFIMMTIFSFMIFLYNQRNLRVLWRNNNLRKSNNLLRKARLTVRKAIINYSVSSTLVEEMVSWLPEIWHCGNSVECKANQQGQSEEQSNVDLAILGKRACFNDYRSRAYIHRGIFSTVLQELRGARTFEKMTLMK